MSSINNKRRPRDVLLETLSYTFFDITKEELIKAFFHIREVDFMAALFFTIEEDFIVAFFYILQNDLMVFSVMNSALLYEKSLLLYRRGSVWGPFLLKCFRRKTLWERLLLHKKDFFYCIQGLSENFFYSIEGIYYIYGLLSLYKRGSTLWLLLLCRRIPPLSYH